MKKFLILSATLLASVFFVVAMCSALKAASSRSGVAALPNSPATPKQTNIAPGNYAAKPYSMAVVVPKAIDEKMVAVTIALGSKITTIEPEIRLEKR